MASAVDDTVKEAWSLIADAKLHYPEGPLLSSFVTNALHPRLAAEYLLKRCHSTSDPASEILELLADWRFIVLSRKYILDNVT